MKCTLLTFFAFILFVRVTCADEASKPDFSHYPQTVVYKDAFGQGLRDSDILGISAFAGSGGFFLEYSVSEKGEEFDVRDVTDFAMEASHSKQLSSDQMKALVLAIGELPTENTYGPADHLVIIRTRKGASTITRCYDGKNLPKAIHEIYAIIGERFETAGIK